MRNTLRRLVGVLVAALALVGTSVALSASVGAAPGDDPGPDASSAPEPSAGDPRDVPGGDAVEPPPSELRTTLNPLTGGAPNALQTSEFMAGTVGVSVVFVESDGSVGNCSDTSTEDWNLLSIAGVMREIADGMTFWEARANAPAVDFVFENRGIRGTSCEPITHPGNTGPSASTFERNWISEVLTDLGVSASPTNYFDAARQYANSRRGVLGTDWATTVFMVDSSNDFDGQFSNSTFAYAFFNGPFMVMTYDNGNWGIDRMNLVAAHEMGHIFGAADEYSNSNCTTSSRWGYLWVTNDSCNTGGITADFSIMGPAVEQEHPFVDVSSSARGAIGWRNPQPGPFGLTVVDVVRTANTALFPYAPDPSPDPTPTYLGQASDVPFPPGGGGHQPVSIARATTVQARVDGGLFSPGGVAPDDGAFDGQLESFTFTPPNPLTVGAHTIAMRTVNDFGHVSPVVSDSLSTTPGPPVAAPTGIGAAPTGSLGTARITYTPIPGSANGGAPVTRHRATCRTFAQPDRAAEDAVAPFGPITVTGMVAGVTYNCTVQAVNEHGAGPASSGVLVNSPPGAPPSVTNAKGATNGSIRVNWTAASTLPGSPLTGHTVICATPGSTKTANVSGAVRTATIGGLDRSTSYRCRVAARNKWGIGPFRVASTITKPR